MHIKPIKSEKEYAEALQEIDRLWDTEPDTPDGDRLEVLMTLVEAYEEKHYAIPQPDPIAALEYYLESRGLTRKDLEPYIGSRGRVSEILNRKRPLTITMIRKLEQGTGIPASILIKPYEIEQDQSGDQPDFALFTSNHKDYSHEQTTRRRAG